MNYFKDENCKYYFLSQGAKVTVIGAQLHVTTETKPSSEIQFSSDKSFYQYDEQCLVLY